VTTYLRYTRQMLLARVVRWFAHVSQLVKMFAALVRQCRPKKPSKPVPKSYSEKWLDGLVAVALPPEVREVGLVNKDGELLDATPQNVIEVLRDPPEVVPKSVEPQDEWHDLDPVCRRNGAAGSVLWPN
jgi:hypothetical protein